MRRYRCLPLSSWFRKGYGEFMRDNYHYSQLALPATKVEITANAVVAD